LSQACDVLAGEKHRIIASVSSAGSLNKHITSRFKTEINFEPRFSSSWAKSELQHPLQRVATATVSRKLSQIRATPHQYMQTSEN
jgi:hypothetical protein